MVFRKKHIFIHSCKNNFHFFGGGGGNDSSRDVDLPQFVFFYFREFNIV